MNKKGRKGELIARHYLLGKNYQLLACNYSKKCGEIDIVAQKGEVVIFVEVKSKIATATNSSSNLELPEASITFPKIRKLKKTAQWFIMENKLSVERSYRFDVISVLIKKNKAKIRHLKHAF